jgi:hypothetical protein
MDPTRTRFATVAFSQMEVYVLNSLIDELSAVLLSNQEATDRLCLTMDHMKYMRARFIRVMDLAKPATASKSSSPGGPAPPLPPLWLASLGA